MANPKIVVVGSANTDMVVRVDTIPHLGETVLGGEFVTAQGGKGANQAVAAARLGAEVTFVTRLGKDDMGKRALAAYQAEGIQTDFISFDEAAPSGVALILVNQKGENIIAVAPGANSNLSPQDVEAAEVAFQTADALLVQLEVPLEAVKTAVQLARKHHIKAILNPAPAVRLPVDILNSIDFLTPNESELAEITGHATDSAPSTGKNFAKQNKLKALIVTLGEKGARLIVDETDSIVPGYPVTAIDTVAAGDAFNGALAVALSSGNNLWEAVRFANAVGALTVTKAGAQPSLPRLEDVQRFLA